MHVFIRKLDQTGWRRNNFRKRFVPVYSPVEYHRIIHRSLSWKNILGYCRQGTGKSSCLVLWEVSIINMAANPISGSSFFRHLQCRDLHQYLGSLASGILDRLYNHPAICLAVFRWRVITFWMFTHVQASIIFLHDASKKTGIDLAVGSDFRISPHLFSYCLLLLKNETQKTIQWIIHVLINEGVFRNLAAVGTSELDKTCGHSLHH